MRARTLRARLRQPLLLSLLRLFVHRHSGLAQYSGGCRVAIGAAAICIRRGGGRCRGRSRCLGRSGLPALVTLDHTLVRAMLRLFRCDGSAAGDQRTRQAQLRRCSSCDRRGGACSARCKRGLHLREAPLQAVQRLPHCGGAGAAACGARFAWTWTMCFEVHTSTYAHGARALRCPTLRLLLQSDGRLGIGLPPVRQGSSQRSSRVGL